MARMVACIEIPYQPLAKIKSFSIELKYLLVLKVIRSKAMYMLSAYVDGQVQLKEFFQARWCLARIREPPQGETKEVSIALHLELV